MWPTSPSRATTPLFLITVFVLKSVLSERRTAPPAFFGFPLPSFLKAEYYSAVRKAHIFLVRSSTDGRLSRFHVLATVTDVAADLKNAAMYKHLRTAPLCVLLGLWPEVQFLDHMVIPFLIFLKPRRTVFHSGRTIVCSQLKRTRVPVSVHLHSHWFSVLFCFFK